MYVLAIYDIENDRIRVKIAEALKDYGLSRIQYSAFQGQLSPNRTQELYFRLKATLGVDVGNIMLFSLCEKDVKQIKEIENVACC